MAFPLEIINNELSIKWIAQFAEWLSLGMYAPNTLRSYIAVASHYAEWLADAADKSPAAYYAYLRSERDLKESTICAYAAAVRLFRRWQKNYPLPAFQCGQWVAVDDFPPHSKVWDNAFPVLDELYFSVFDHPTQQYFVARWCKVRGNYRWVKENGEAVLYGTHFLPQSAGRTVH